MVVKVYTSKHCAPCHEVVDLIKAGRVEGEVEIIDIDTDEGFEKFQKEALEQGDAAVPSAYKDGQLCKILIDDESNKLLFECPTDAPS